MKKFVVIVAFILFCAVATVVEPGFLAENEFLKGFITHEILALLAVILAITMASVANIHLALNRIVRTAFRRNVSKGEAASRPVRGQINSNAWLLFWSFVVCVFALLVKGWFPANIYVISAMNSLALSVLLVNVLVLHDIYKTIFAIVSASLSNSENEDKGDGQTEDYTSDSPEIGTDK